MSIDIRKISDKYIVIVIQSDNISEVYELCKGNPIFYRYSQYDLTLETIEQDLKALPPNKGYDDKFYIGFYKEDKLIAIMDLIIEYPNKETSYIGLFMMNKDFQRNGIGTEIIKDALIFLKKKGFAYVGLGYIRENIEGEKFWLKNMFLPTGVETQTDNYTIISMQRRLRDID